MKVRKYVFVTLFFSILRDKNSHIIYWSLNFYQKSICWAISTSINTPKRIFWEPFSFKKDLHYSHSLNNVSYLRTRNLCPLKVPPICSPYSVLLKGIHKTCGQLRGRTTYTTQALFSKTVHGERRDKISQICPRGLSMAKPQ